MSALTTLADLILLLVASGSAIWAYRSKQTEKPHSVLLGAWSLSALFLALAVIAAWLPQGSADLETLKRLGINLGIYAGMPMLATAVYALGKRLFWSAAGWGRLLLGFFALFELNRQLGYGEEYTNVLGAASVIGVLSGALFLGLTQARILSAAAAVCVAAALAFSGSSALPVMAYPMAATLLAAIGIALLTSAVRLEISQLNQPSQ
ncbi:hypothetical protein [Marinobacterium lutimaris]|uniref:Uncharacterized protein n=1 Tax=Marinobacterium lutimaris TaxID=568106 RepID=A0A1H6D4Q9_9GAMM|nr:hypothetical protein [Marinobacterium lutimaris]SEG80322.1 hypothetical protein SAMN05444390_1059 [Marinobacterium lutimaris]